MDGIAHGLLELQYPGMLSLPGQSERLGNILHSGVEVVDTVDAKDAVEFVEDCNIFELGDHDNVLVEVPHVRSLRGDAPEMAPSSGSEAPPPFGDVSTCRRKAMSLLRSVDMRPHDAHDTAIEEAQDGGMMDVWDSGHRG